VDTGSDETTGSIAAITHLTTMDAPMIQARMEKLGIFEVLEGHQADRLKRLIKEHCQEGREEVWWGPLQEFAKGLRYQRGEAPCVVISSRTWKIKMLRNDIDALSYMVRDSGIQLDDIQKDDGKPAHDEDDIKAAEYRIAYKRGETAATFDVHYKEGVLDVIGLVRTLNGVLNQTGDSHRIFVLPPVDPYWCLVYTTQPAAERAAQSRWGRLPMPK